MPAFSPAPSLRTDRLRLRPFTAADAPAMQALADRREIADTMISIPHPYPLEQVGEWIARHPAEWSARRAAHFGIETRQDARLLGAIELRAFDHEHLQTELSLWIGRDWWGQGYATEAASAAVDFAFRQLRFNRVYAFHMLRNPASGRVLEKIGMTREGLLRQRVRKWGRFEDVYLWAVLARDRSNLSAASFPSPS